MAIPPSIAAAAQRVMSHIFDACLQVHWSGSHCSASGGQTLRKKMAITECKVIYSEFKAGKQKSKKVCLRWLPCNGFPFKNDWK